MKKTIFNISLILLLSITNGCGSTSPKVSEEEAESIAIEQSSGSIGEVNVTSVSHRSGKYIIEWENDENCESGVLHIDDQNGELIKGENTIC